MALRQYLAEEVALDHAAGQLTRREALRRLGMMGFSAGAAVALLAACGGDNGGSAATTGATATTTGATTATTAASTTAAAAGTTAASNAAAATTTPPVAVEDITFPGPSTTLQAAWAPAVTAKGGVLVIHENRGLSAFVRSMAMRLAIDGYSSLAIDLLSAEGGTAALGDNATAALSAAPMERFIADLQAGVSELERRLPGSKLAVIGFCFGGGMTWSLLQAGEPRVAAAVPFYGPAPTPPDFSKSAQAAVFGVYAEDDARVNASRQAAEDALTAVGAVYQVKTYSGVGHGFMRSGDDVASTPQAAEAYTDMVNWFATHLA